MFSIAIISKGILLKLLDFTGFLDFEHSNTLLVKLVNEEKFQSVRCAILISSYRNRFGLGYV